MPTRTLYGYYRSSAAYRTRIALNLKGLSHEKHSIHLRKGDQFLADYAKLNPQRQVPTLIDEDDSVLIQSPAILEYLEETCPEPPLLPQGAAARARVRAIAMAIGCDIHPLNNLRVLTYLRGNLELAEERVTDWIHNWIGLGFQAIEQMLSDSKATGDYCHGDTPTLADIYLAPQVYGAERFNCPLDAYPTIARVHANASKLAAFIDAYPDTQPDAE